MAGLHAPGAAEPFTVLPIAREDVPCGITRIAPTSRNDGNDVLPGLGQYTICPNQPP